MMKLNLLLLLIMCPGLLLAQAEAEEAILQQLSSPLMQSVNTSALIQQEGAMHEARVQQASQNSRVGVHQRGYGHQLQATEEGIGNRWNIRQEGSGHELVGLLRGDDNLIEVHQTGRDNSLIQELIGNGMDYKVSQNGERLELIQIEHDPLQPAYQVTQTGQDMRITIEQGIIGQP